MPRQLTPALRHLTQTLAHAESDAAADAQLLERFVRGRDEAAFELLVWRHGPMVLGVCRRFLANRHDAEDAFQATFLVLARKAGSIGKRGAVGSWLYKVAARVALRARTAVHRRALHEQQTAAVAIDPRGSGEPVGQDVRAVLDDELGRLPEKYRAPVVLCYLEGRTNLDAARLLRCPAGTVKTRLAHARRLLADRLARRGVMLGAALAAVSAAVPMALAMNTARAAVRMIAPDGGAGAVSAHVSGLTEGVLRTMLLTKVKMATVALAAVLAVTGLGVVSYRTFAAGPAEAPPPAADAENRVRQLKKQIADLKEELRTAEAEAARDQPPPDPKAPVAVIFDDVTIPRAELGEYLIRRMTRSQLDAFVNHCILEHACRRRGIVVTAREVETATDADIRAVGGRAAFEETLRKHQKSLAAWKEDVVRPRLQMQKLCRDRVHVGERALRAAFEATYGEKVECQVIILPRDLRGQADAVYAKVRNDPAEFARRARAQGGTLAVTDGRMPPIGRNSGVSKDLERIAFRLEPGQVSPPIDTPSGLLIVKCLRRIPADPDVEFEDVRDRLEREVRERLVQQEIVNAFQELREQARPRLLWQPPAE